jgi:hypothetical protein
MDINVLSLEVCRYASRIAVGRHSEFVIVAVVKSKHAAGLDSRRQLRRRLQ